MSTYREAIHHARSGGTARRGGKEIRFLTFEEAEPIILEVAPSRRYKLDSEGNKVVKDGNLVVEEYADPSFSTKRLGLYDVGVHPAVPIVMSDEDMYEPIEHDEEGNPKPRVFRTDWVCEGGNIKPEAVAPETVDEALAETLLAEHHDFDEKIGPHKGEEPPNDLGPL